MRTRVQPLFSRKITVLSVWAMISVLVIHSKALSSSSADWNIFIQWFFTRALAKWSVPFFFAVSGFWFARSMGEVDCYSFVFGGGAKKLLVKKAKTLLAPYLLWAVIGTALGLPLICFNNYVQHRCLWERTVFESGTVWGFINSLFGITVHAPMGNAPLWYVRALLLFFVLAPLWVLLLKKVRCLLWVVGAMAVVVPGVSIGFLPAHYVLGWGWAIVGCLLSEMRFDERQLPRWLLFLCAPVFIALCVSEAACQVGWVGVGELRSWLYMLIPVFGVPTFWIAYDWLCGGDRELPAWTKWTFWIYCIHQVFTSYFMSSVLFVLGKSDVVSLIVMLVTPVVGVALSAVSAIGMERTSVKAFQLLTGGRAR